ncbi:MAG: hypothetical protein K0U93_03730 [Gammaproteobacteria bacterium]|nr:hypothetical protein [Gammaproteobacteria bacterium]
MNRRLRTFLRSVLILIVASGPLQAQTVFACSMMDMVMEECCCGDHIVGDATVEANEEPCCEQSVEIRVDEDARQDLCAVRPLEVGSDVDPPHAIVAPFDVVAVPQERSAFVVYLPPLIVRSSGTDTYLITQRLRI